jgi:hypothetical protein
MLATCSVCGTNAKMKAVGKYFACAFAQRTSQHNWAKAHPERAKESHKVKPSKHRLTNRDGNPDICAVCGPVDVVPVGRGYECGVNSRARGVKNPPKAPQSKCIKCLTVYLTHEGICLECDTLDLIGAEYRGMRPSKTTGVDGPAADWDYEANSTLEDDLMTSFVPADLPDTREAAVFGWRTLGSPLAWNKPLEIRGPYVDCYGAV